MNDISDLVEIAREIAPIEANRVCSDDDFLAIVRESVKDVPPGISGEKSCLLLAQGIHRRKRLALSAGGYA